MANVVETAANSARKRGTPPNGAQSRGERNRERGNWGNVPPVIDVVLEKPGGTNDYERLKHLPKLKVGDGEAVTIIGTVELPEIPELEAISNKEINDKFEEVFRL